MNVAAGRKTTTTTIKEEHIIAMVLKVQASRYNNLGTHGKNIRLLGKFGLSLVTTKIAQLVKDLQSTQ